MAINDRADITVQDVAEVRLSLSTRVDALLTLDRRKSERIDELERQNSALWDEVLRLRQELARAKADFRELSF